MIKGVLEGSSPDHELKTCFDCDHCQAAVSWWCVNKEAVSARGTNIPGASNCPFWKPVRRYEELSWWEKTFGNHIVLTRR